MLEFLESLDFKKVRKWAITGAITVAVIAFILSNVFVTKENEYRVVRQFGEIVKIIDEPGLNVKIPFIQTLEVLPKQLLSYDVPTAEINTKDKKRMTIDNYTAWKIEDPKEMISNLRTTQNAEAKMGEIIFSAVRAELGQLDYDQIISDENPGRKDLNSRITDKVNELLKRDNYGISVVDVRIKRTDLPEENEQSVYTRMISERETKAQEYLSMGDAKNIRIKANADKEVKEVIAKAEADAQVIVGKGEGEAAKIYNDSFSRDPGFYELYRTLESYKKTINDETMIILPASSPYAKMLMGYTE